MKIIIIGDGKVGYSLAENLSSEDNDVTIIDKSAEALKKPNENLDVICIKGSGISTGTLIEAGVKDVNVLIAATTSDELNMVCCLTAKRLGAERTIARIRDFEYSQELSMLKEEIGLDMIINPEQSAAYEIARILRFPNAMNIESFAKGRVELVELKVSSDMPINGLKIKNMENKIPESVLIGAVVRNNNVFIPDGEFIVKENDIIHIIGKPASLYDFCEILGKCNQRIKNLMIAGGSRITYYLTTLLSNVKIKIIEISKEKCLELSEKLPNSLIIQGDCTDEEILQSENIKNMDAFISITGNDEENLMSALLAQQNGVPKVITKINKINYVNIIQKLGIESVISPRLIISRQILRYVRGLKYAVGNKIESLYRIVGGKAEIVEFTANEDASFLNIPLKNLKIVNDVLFSTIVRKGKIIIPRGNDFIQKGDRVIVITNNKNISDLNEVVSAGGNHNEFKDNIKKFGNIINM
jgi:trk system potassium uptake protein